jgi:hypothetical protein
MVKVKGERSDGMRERGKKAENNSKSKSKGKGKGKAKAGNHIGDGSPVRELSSSRHPTDPWDDLRNAWAVEFSQSKKGGPSRGTHQNQNHSQPPKQKQHQNQNQNRDRNHHPNGQQSGSASSAQNRRGRGGGGGGSGGHVHAGQKRKATGSVTNGITGTDDDRGGRAPKRQKSEKRPQPQPPPPRSNRDPDPNADSDSPGAAARPHPDFWLPDGSVIIQVEQTKFRLHQSRLRKFSGYFAAAFGEKGNHHHKRGGRAYLEVEIDERSPNGHHLPVYRVAETTADDFAALMTVFEEQTCVTVLHRCFIFLPAPRPSGETAIAYCTFLRAFDRRNRNYADEIPPMPVLAGILRAARALSFEAQRTWAERIFKRMWPATLDTLTTDPIPHAAVALVLARTCGLRGVQKRASYELLRMPTFGQAITAAPGAHVEVQEDSRADADADADIGLDELPRAEMLRLLHAREQLVLAWAEIAGKAPTDFVCPRGTQTQIMPESGGGSCTTTTTTTTTTSNDGRRLDCASANADRVHARWAELVHTTGLYVQRMVHPLMGLQDLKKIPWKEEGFCKKCVVARTKAWDRFRRKLWDDLDVWLQLTDAENV